uniref:Uncharacterized protein n=1 Tax=Lepeophtheirus salmonis TaxID=72036 RepID=A0A0K2V832_LEPSM
MVTAVKKYLEDKRGKVASPWSSTSAEDHGPNNKEKSWP